MFFLQLFPSNDERIDLENDFADSFYQEFMKYNNPPIKIGFSVDYLLDNKPSILEFNETKKWKNKLAKLKDEEELTYEVLYQNYDKLASLLD